MSDKWKQWKIPIVIVVFVMSMIFSINYLNNSSDEDIVGDTETESIPSVMSSGQCYLCHPDGKVGNKSILENIEDTVDKEKSFRTWFILSYMLIVDDLKCVSKAAKSEDFDQIEICARVLKENSNRSLSQINSYNTSNISADLRLALDLYKISLKNYHIGGENLETGAIGKNISVMDSAIRYIQNGTKYASDAIIILKRDNRSNIMIDTKTSSKE